MPRCTECDRLVELGEPCGWCVTAPDPEPDPKARIEELRALTRRKDKR